MLGRATPRGDSTGQRALALTLLMLFAATFPEVLSLSTPVPVLASPAGGPGFLMLLGMYGAGAVLVWEAVARWRKGWLAVLPLGAAYGIAEEGFATKVFVNPQQQLVVTSLPGEYGRWAGVEWATFVPIDMFHAAISIGLQVLLISLLFPELKGRSLLSTRGLVVVAAAFTVDIGLQFFTVGGGPEPVLLPAIAFLGAVGALLLLATWRLPNDFMARWMRSPEPTARPASFFLVGFGWLLSLLLVFLLGSHLVPWPQVLLAFDLSSGGGTLYFLATRSGWRNNRSQQVAFVGGLGGAFLVLDGIFGTLIGDWEVLPFTALFLGIVVYLWRRPSRVEVPSRSASVISP